MSRGRDKTKPSPEAIMSSDSDEGDDSASEQNSVSQGSSVPESDDSFHGDSNDVLDGAHGLAARKSTPSNKQKMVLPSYKKANAHSNQGNEPMIIFGTRPLYDPSEISTVSEATDEILQEEEIAERQRNKERRAMAKVQRRKLRERARTERMRMRRTQDRELKISELTALTAVGALASEILQMESTRERAAIALLRSQEQMGVMEGVSAHHSHQHAHPHHMNSFAHPNGSNGAQNHMMPPPPHGFHSHAHFDHSHDGARGFQEPLNLLSDQTNLAMFDPALLRPPMSAAPRLHRRGSFNNGSNGHAHKNPNTSSSIGSSAGKRSRDQDDDDAKAEKELLRLSRGDEFMDEDDSDGEDREMVPRPRKRARGRSFASHEDDSETSKNVKSSFDKGANLCCHYCRISRTRQRKKSVLYLSCTSCSNTYCSNCCENYLQIPFEQKLNDESWRCDVCTGVCCCCFEFCSRQHHHCFTYRRTQQRHKQKPLKYSKKKKRESGDEGDDDDDDEDESSNSVPRFKRRQFQPNTLSSSQEGHVFPPHALMPLLPSQVGTDGFLRPPEVPFVAHGPAAPPPQKKGDDDEEDKLLINFLVHLQGNEH